MIVPGLTAGGFMIQRLRSSGPLFGTTPPAIVLREATPARLGPTLPLAPGMPGITWQAPQPFVAINWAPSAGLAAGAGGAAAGAVGAGAPAAGPPGVAPPGAGAPGAAP